MKRLTDKRLALPPGVWQEVTREQRIELQEIPVPSKQELYYRLSQIEDILCDGEGEDEYDLYRLAVMCNQRMSMRDEVSERFSLTTKIPLDRLRELVEADREGRCVVLPCKEGDTIWRVVNDAAPHVAKDKCLCIGLYDGSVWIHLVNLPPMNVREFGRLLFLTHAEADDALKARGQDE